MNFRRALGFFAVGAVFALLPRIAPGLFPATGADGSSTRMIWLQIMSLLQMGLGLSYFAHRTIVGLASLLVYAPRPALAHGATTRVPQPASVARPAFAVVRSLSPIGALQSGLIEQRQAA